MTDIQNRFDFTLIFDVENGNPNGDPDAGNLPRTDPETGHGLVTDVCIKRKVRNYISYTKNDQDGFEIYMADKAVLNNLHKRGYEGSGETPGKKLPKGEKGQKITKRMCDLFFDIRTFGAVMANEVNAGQVRGPIQLTFGKSNDPIVPAEVTITRSSVTNEKDSDKERTMGSKSIVPYGLYRMNGFVNPMLAKQTGFSQEDLEIFWDALGNMFEFDRSAARGMMSTRNLFVFKHDKSLGNAKAHTLFDKVNISLISDGPARSYSDYSVSVNTDGLPDGVSVEDKIKV